MYALYQGEARKDGQPRGGMREVRAHAHTVCLSVSHCGVGSYGRSTSPAAIGSRSRRNPEGTIRGPSVDDVVPRRIVVRDISLPQGNATERDFQQERGLL